MAKPKTMPAETPLFYRAPVPLDRERHRKLKAGAANANYGFARGSHVIPALIDEFSPASRELPIVFMPGPKVPTAVFLVGLAAGRNALLREDGGWSSSYVPAYLRRYPFILGEAEGQDPLVCIDEENPILTEAEGEPLFTEDGESTPALTRAIDFTNEYFLAGKRTEAFVALMQGMDLFRSITIESRGESGQAQTVHGLLAIDEAKLYDLSDEQFLRLREERVLAPIFAHFFSLTQVERLRDKAQTAS